MASSLRDIYASPVHSWSFVPPQINASVPAPPTPISSYQWSTRPPPNSIFDLSPSLSLSEPSGIDIRLLLKTLVASAFLQYTSTALAMPLEVGKLLLQVQWVPRDLSLLEGHRSADQEVEDDGEMSDSSNDQEGYFIDPTSQTPARYPRPPLSDERGYIIRRSVLEEDTKPEFLIPVASADGVWGMVKRVVRSPNEGWLALWKGLLTSCISDLLTSTLQPVVHSLLQSIFIPAPTLPSSFSSSSLVLPVASHLITGFILSPLDLVRTRLIVQSSIPRHRSYTGPIDALSQILRQEGGLKGIYLHPHLLIPTILDNAIRPILSLALPPYIAAHLGLHGTVDANPIAWALAELVATCAGLLLILPFETIRRRLQAQVRGTAEPIKSCVESRPAPYNGVVDVLWHILTEERSDLPERSKGKETRAEGESWWRTTGVGQLYRGLGMRLSASVVVFMLGVVNGGYDSEAGWAEL